MVVTMLTMVVLGVVQGVTEFLPISSSGHLIVARAVLPELPVDALAFDVLLHGATFGAVAIALWPDVVRLARGLAAWFVGRPTQDSRQAGILVLASLPAALAGGFFGAAIEEWLRSTGVVIVTLAAVALVFLWIERRPHGARALESVGWRDGLAIGSAQALALIPGVSRSGITIVAGLTRGLQRAAAGRFAFLLALPAIAGAALVELPALWRVPLSVGTWFGLAAGAFSALLTGVASIRWFLQWLRSGTLRPFAYYRLVLAAIVFLLWLRS